METIAEEENSVPKAKKPKGRKNPLTGIVVFVLVIGGCCWWASSVSSDTDKPKTTFSSSMTLAQPINPATATFEALVQNTGKVAGSPQCVVQMMDASYVYKGFDTFEFDKVLQPGEKWGFKGRLTITKEGAAYVTKGSISCS